MTRLRTGILFHVGVILFQGFWVAVSGQTYSEALTTPPADSVEAERVRIWLPIERQGRCRVTIDVLNDSNRVIRHLINRLLPRGYHNFYWDKKDDSGSYVRAGKYLYLMNNCGKKSYGELHAQFAKWELASRVSPPQERWSSRIIFELLDDSAFVSIHVFNRRGKVVDEPVMDSLMNTGKYEFEWSPAAYMPRGFYVVKLTIGDFTHSVEIGYKP